MADDQTPATPAPAGRGPSSEQHRPPDGRGADESRGLPDGLAGGGRAEGAAAGGNEPPAAAEEGEFIGHARTVSILTLLSRVTGLLRDAVLAAVLGMTAIADAFFIGFLVPNLFRRLFGEGALTSAFIPHYAEALKEDRALARRLASLCLAALAVALAGLTLVGEAVLAAMLMWGQWAEETALAIRLVMLMLPYMPLICLVALIGGVLHVHGRFGPPAAAPMLLNLTLMAGAAVAAWTGGSEPMGRQGVTILAMSVLAAGVVQLIWQLMVLRRIEPLTTDFHGAWQYLRRIAMMMLPMLLGLAIFQFNAFFDSLLAFALAPRGERDTLWLFGREVACPVEPGAVAALQWAQRLYQFPLGVFGIAVATAIFPALSRAATAGGDDDGPAGGDFAGILRRGLRLTVFIALPASVGLLLVGLPLARLIFERGQFELADSIRVATILAGYASAVWAYSMMHVLTRAYHALKDAQTPLRVGLVMVAMNVALNLVLIWPLGAAGLAWSTAITATVQVVVLAILLRRQVLRPVDAEVVTAWLRSAALCALMAAIVVPPLVYFEPAGLMRSQSALLLGAMVLIGATVYLLGARLWGLAELRWMMRRST